MKWLVGGSGKQGRVLDIRGWDNESGRSVANIAWDNGSTNVYRLGHKGKIDLKYIQDASGGVYYREHLLKLGNIAWFHDSVVWLYSVSSLPNRSKFLFFCDKRPKILKKQNFEWMMILWSVLLFRCISRT